MFSAKGDKNRGQNDSWKLNSMNKTGPQSTRARKVLEKTSRIQEWQQQQKYENEIDS